MNRLIIQEIEKFLSRSIVYAQEDTVSAIKLVATDLVTGKEIIFENNFNICGTLTLTTYRISHISSNTFFEHLNADERKKIFNIAYDRYKEYFKNKDASAKMEFYKSLLKNNHQVK